MEYNLNLYRHTVVPQIKAWFEARPGLDIIEELGLIAIATSCPIVCVAELVLETFGPNVEVEKSLESFKAFYRVENIIGRAEK